MYYARKISYEAYQIRRIPLQSHLQDFGQTFMTTWSHQLISTCLRMVDKTIIVPTPWLSLTSCHKAYPPRAKSPFLPNFSSNSKRGLGIQPFHKIMLTNSWKHKIESGLNADCRVFVWKSGRGQQEVI